MKFLCSLIIITFKSLWIQKAWALVRFTRLKNSPDTTFGLIIIKTKLTQLPMLYCASSKEVQTKKMFFELRTSKSFIGYSLCWSTLAALTSLALLFFLQTWLLYIEFSSAKHMFFSNYVTSKICCKFELVDEGSYKASIGDMRLRLQKLKEEVAKAQKIRKKKRENWEEIDKVLHHQGLSFIS